VHEVALCGAHKGMPFSNADACGTWGTERDAEGNASGPDVGGWILGDIPHRHQQRVITKDHCIPGLLQQAQIAGPAPLAPAL
jgi:hypothetical protein